MSIVLLPDKPILSFDEYLSTQVGGKAIEKAHEIGGGLHEKHSIKAVFSGVSNEVNMPNDLDVKLDYDDFKARGSSLGSVGLLFMMTQHVWSILHIFSPVPYRLNYVDNVHHAKLAQQQLQTI